MAAFSEAQITVSERDAGPSSPQLRSRLATAGRHRRRRSGQRSIDDDDAEKDASDDELFDELEREIEDEERGAGVLGRLREERIAELQRQIADDKAARNTPQGIGKLTEPSSEKELMHILGDRGGELAAAGGQQATGSPVIVHFYHKEFRRCDIMDKHLELLAAQHPEAIFVKISVLSAPFLVEKLGVKVLPCLVVFGWRAQVKDQIIGFEDLGNSDGFTTQTLEWRLAQGGALHDKATSANSHISRPILGFGSQASRTDFADDELDWD